jgi:UDPglucose 6-dehydrogenase
MKVGFIGQGFIGKNYADDFENRGLNVVRYSLESPYVENRALIPECDFVFIAVPTPTTARGFDDSIVRSAIESTRDGAVIIVKSTLIPGTTESLQETYHTRTIMHSPEFLREKTAAYDAAHPERTIIGIAREADRSHAEHALSLMAPAPYTAIVPARTAELVKYAGNCFLATKVVFMNLLHDMATREGVDWSQFREALIRDPRIGESHTEPVHESGHGGQSGRGAGGHCFIKDFAAFRAHYESRLPADHAGIQALRAIEEKNIDLLRMSSKDLDLLEAVYGV